MTTANEIYTDIAGARRLIGRDAIVRDDPCFGRRGKMARVIPDDKHGYLVAVHLYKTTKNRRGEWEELDKPTPDSRRFWAPDKVELA